MIRLALVMTVFPTIVSDWYVPFLQVSIDPITTDPWRIWLEQDGNLSAFPYGYVMWLAFLPLTLLVDALGLHASYGYGITLIMADLAILLLFVRLIPNRNRFLLLVYWLSPIIIFASYLLGFNDVVPVFFLILSLYFLRNCRFILSGLFCCLAISAKLSMY